MAARSQDARVLTFNRIQMKTLTETDILWFSKRTKVFSHEIYLRDSSPTKSQ